MKRASSCRAMGSALPRSAYTYTFTNHTYTEATMATLVRKNVFLDPATLKRAQAILGRRSESEAIREALELVAFRTKVMKGYDRAAGKGRGFCDVWQLRRTSEIGRAHV